MISVSGNNWEEENFNKRIIEKIKIDLNCNDILTQCFLSPKCFKGLPILRIRINMTALLSKFMLLCNMKLLKVSGHYILQCLTIITKFKEVPLKFNKTKNSHLK